MLFWLVTGWLIANGFSIDVQEITIEDGVETVVILRNNDIILKLIIAISLSSISFYLNLANISNLYKTKKGLQILLFSFVLIVVPISLFYVIESYLMSATIRLPISIILGIFFFYFTISVAYGITKVWQKAERQKQQLALEKNRAELTMLRAQLHPHFLFNVLNNLLAMVDQKANPVLASSLDRLSGLLRYVVYDTDVENVTIRKEIEFIRNFSALQIQRFENEEIDFELEIIGEHDLQKIEPGIFIPFVENVFKYGVEPEKKSKVKISFDLTEPNKIKFESTNPIYPALQKNKGNRSGISSTKARLQLVYPNCHKLTIIENETFQVHLEFKTNESDHS